MELAVPGIAIGLLWLATQQKKNKENFTGDTLLPNTNIPDVNYDNGFYEPANPEIDQSAELTVNNRYDGEGAYTDKYFNANMNQSNLSMPSTDNSPQFYSLTGEKVSAEYFKHTNMQPFFGSKSRSMMTNGHVNEGLLDSYSGAGSQSITKKEQSPLFAPNENMQWAHGAPNRNDFFQSRVNASSKMSNVLP